MTRIVLSSAAIAAMLSLSAQPAPAQSYNPKEFPMHFDNVQKKAGTARQPSSLSGQRRPSGGNLKIHKVPLENVLISPGLPQASKNKHKGEIEILSINPGASSSAARKRRPVAR